MASLRFSLKLNTLDWSRNLYKAQRDFNYFSSFVVSKTNLITKSFTTMSKAISLPWNVGMVGMKLFGNLLVHTWNTLTGITRFILGSFTLAFKALARTVMGVGGLIKGAFGALYDGVFSLKSAILGGALGGGLIALFTQATRKAADFETMLKAIQVTAGKSASAITSMISSSKGFTGGIPGASPQDNARFKSLIGRQGGLFSNADTLRGAVSASALGANEKTIRDLMQPLRDAAALFSEDMETAFIAVVRAARQGEPELAERIGLQLRENAVLKESLELYGKRLGQLTIEQKENVVYTAALRQLARYRGAEQQLLKTTAGAFRRLNAEVQDSTILLGQGFNIGMRNFDFLHDFTDWLRNNEETVKSWGYTIGSSLFRNLQKLFNFLGFQGIDIGGILNKTVNMASTAFDKLGDLIVSFLEKLKEWWPTIKTVLSSAWSGIKSVASFAMRSLYQMITPQDEGTVASGVGSFARRMFAGGKAGLGNLLGGVQGSGIGDVIGNGIRSLMDTIASKFEGMVRGLNPQKIADSITSAMNQIKSFFTWLESKKSLIDKILDSAERLLKKVEENIPDLQYGAETAKNFGQSVGSVAAPVATGSLAAWAGAKLYKGYKAASPYLAPVGRVMMRNPKAAAIGAGLAAGGGYLASKLIPPPSASQTSTAPVAEPWIPEPVIPPHLTTAAGTLGLSGLTYPRDFYRGFTHQTVRGPGGRILPWSPGYRMGSSVQRGLKDFTSGLQGSAPRNASGQFTKHTSSFRAGRFIRGHTPRFARGGLGLLSELGVGALEGGYDVPDLPLGANLARGGIMTAFPITGSLAAAAMAPAYHHMTPYFNLPSKRADRNRAKIAQGMREIEEWRRYGGSLYGPLQAHPLTSGVDAASLGAYQSPPIINNTYVTHTNTNVQPSWQATATIRSRQDLQALPGM